ncbi:polysaccharide deacetylase family protein [Flavihumibacter solisilvae]|uniref:polysaccharide deacetylase family protein n=1 Tax=Flavihumibacter solisilvae TaxID=1349421 RepID=UPI0006906C79|nr:polysaccharide deacetylase family protein [Flavihumibacter solisilvae]
MKNCLNFSIRTAAFGLLIGSLVSCEWKEPAAQASVLKPGPAPAKTEASANTAANHASPAEAAPPAGTVKIEPASTPAAEIMARKQVPILCYHQVRDYRPTDSKSARDYIVPTADFKAQMKGLADSGYTTILPEQLYQYLSSGTQLPEKSVMITFDDGCDEQFDITRDILKPLDFKAAFFIMTVSVNRPNFMRAEQLKQLSDEGHSIGLHTWDHHNVKQYQGDDWVKQIEKPKAQLEKITGRPVQFFAYPFGLWNQAAIPELKSRGMVAAFQLSTPRLAESPLYTIRRIIVPGGWTGAQLVNRMKSGFKG